MPEILLNNQRIQAEGNKNLLTLAKEQGLRIPSLCYHPALTPAASCKLCAVEVKLPEKPAQIKLACTLKLKEGMEIRTESESVTRARTTAFKRLITYAPESNLIRQMADEFSIDLGPVPDECIRCLLCVRACKEIVGAGALTTEKREGTLFVVPREGNRCIGCGTCVNICPTGAIRMKDKDNIRYIYIRDEIIGQNPLLRCEACGKYFATGKFLDLVQERERRANHPELKEQHRYCPTCAKLLSDRVKTSSQIK